jgi:hypothetical protein
MNQLRLISPRPSAGGGKVMSLKVASTPRDKRGINRALISPFHAINRALDIIHQALLASFLSMPASRERSFVINSFDAALIINLFPKIRLLKRKMFNGIKIIYQNSLESRECLRSLRRFHFSPPDST